MRVFIYNELVDNANNPRVAQMHNLFPHLQYLADLFHLCQKFETKDPEKADYFLAPIFLTGWQFVNQDPGDLINRVCTHLHRGNHILVSTGDVGQRAESRHEMTHEANPQRAYDKKYQWLDDRFILIALESMASLHPQDIAILPYQVKPITPRQMERDILMSFMGVLAHPYLPPDHMRGGRLIEFKSKLASEDIVVGAPEEIATRMGRPVDYHEVMARSIFTLCPGGYGRWSFRLIEALLHGSIPIVMSDDYVLPFANKIKWDDYVYVLSESKLSELPEFVSSIPLTTILQKQRNIRRDRALFEKDFTLGQVVERLQEKMSPADIAISKMRGPREMKIICVDVTNKCDLACSNCTRLLEQQDAYWEMSPENFRLALQSLKNYRGIIAMIGGNPCVHTQFVELCRIFREEIPNQYQRGLWTNNYFKHREVIELTFGALNLNPHNVERAKGNLKDLYNKMVVERGFNGGFYEKPSEHAPLLTAVKDLYPEKEMWEKIAGCDINREWSASIVQNKGQLRAYFCEVAASFDLARNQDHGIPLTADWWQTPIEDFSSQIKHFCPGCGCPARLKGNFDHEDIDTYTESNADLAEKSAKNKKRRINLLKPENLLPLGHKVTLYEKRN